jgi:hypothetical protein
MTIYDLPGMSLDFAATSANIKAGYLATGIFSYNRDVFPDEEFPFSYITDRTAPATDIAIAKESIGKINHDVSAGPGPSRIHSLDAGLPKERLPQTPP